MKAGSPVAKLLLDLVAIDSTNPLLVPGGAGEQEFVQVVAARLAAGGFEPDIWQVAPGRPNLVARLAGRGNGRSLMFCGHSDVVGAHPDAFRPRLEGGRLSGRGALDMKGGIAAAVIALERLAAGPSLAGDIVLALCVDEEWRSLGAAARARLHRLLLRSAPGDVAGEVGKRISRRSDGRRLRARVSTRRASGDRPTPRRCARRARQGRRQRRGSPPR